MNPYAIIRGLLKINNLYLGSEMFYICKCYHAQKIHSEPTRCSSHTVCHSILMVHES